MMKGILKSCLVFFLLSLNQFDVVCKMINKLSGVPLWRRLILCFALKLLKVSTHELVCKYLFISPKATPLLTPTGWNDLACT